MCTERAKGGKADRLRYQKENGQRVAEDDFEYAQDVLRLEVQCGSQFLRTLREKLHVGHTFGEMIDFKTAFHAVEVVYNRVFKGGEALDYYVYKAAKKSVEKSEAAKKALYAAATHHDIIQPKYAHGVKVVKKSGIYPYCFLPKDGGVEWLENPLKLIRKKLAGLGVDIS